MNIYNDKEVDYLKDNMEPIIKKSEELKKQLLDPDKDKVTKELTNFMIKYVIDNKRKVYGGFALDLLLKDKGDEGIYDDTVIPDVDMYTPEPILDMMKICNELYDKGYTDVVGREAQHKETYGIFSHREKYLDLTYVPRNVYNRMPFKQTKEGINCIDPHFFLVDYFRMATDPVSSYWRIEKMIPRVHRILKYFPLIEVNEPMKVVDKHKDDMSNIMRTIFNYLLNKKDIIVVGLYAYNRYLVDSKLTNKNINIVDVPFYDILVENYTKQSEDIINHIKEKHSDKLNDFGITEYYPFFQFKDYNATFNYKGQPILKLTSTNGVCLPYRDIDAIDFTDEKQKKLKEQIRIGNFDMMMKTSMIDTMYYYVNKDKDRVRMYKTMTSDLIKMRNHYLKAHNKHLLDDTIFQSFTLQCIGEPIDPQREFEALVKLRKQQNKPYVFKYEPATKKKKEESNYVFSNSSGNAINNTNNLKLFKK